LTEAHFQVISEVSGHEFVKLMEKYDISPRELGITPAYMAQLKRGLRKPSRRLITKLMILCKERRVTKLLVNNISMGLQAIPTGSHHELHHIFAKPEIKTREPLEAVVARVFKDLGFTVTTNVVVTSLIGKHLELDVLCKLELENIPIYVYVSCKNAFLGVDRDIVAQEVGRLLLMPFRPNILMLVTSRIHDDAKRFAVMSGFIPVEVGFKVTNRTSKEVYKILKKKLEILFKRQPISSFSK